MQTRKRQIDCPAGKHKQNIRLIYVSFISAYNLFYKNDTITNSCDVRDISLDGMLMEILNNI